MSQSLAAVYWLEQKQADVPACLDWLTPGERAHLGAMRFPKRGDDWRLGRWTAKRAVAAYLGETLQSIEIRSAESGAPEVFVDSESAPVKISLSHRSGVALCALTENSTGLGCDLELIEDRCDAFLTDYFTDEEQALVADAPPAEQGRLITLLWSAKESVLKALRVGLRADPRSITCGIGLPACPRARGAPRSATVWSSLHACSNGQAFEGWWREAEGLVRTFAYFRGDDYRNNASAPRWIAAAPAIPVRAETQAGAAPRRFHSSWTA